jgi:alcohol dehydrogenase class IV
MAVASLEAGIAFSNAILGAVHALAHPLGGTYDLHHGLANAILLPVVVRRNLEHAPEKFAGIAKAIGLNQRGMSVEKIAEQVPGMIEQLIEDLKIPKTLSAVGVRPDDIPALARDANLDLCMETNPHHYTVKEIESMYWEAL